MSTRDTTSGPPALHHNPIRVRFVIVVFLGVLAVTAVLGLWWIGYSAGVTSFPPFDLTDRVIRLTPGEVASWTIANLQFNARRLALAGGILAWVALGAILGLILRQRPGARSGAILGLVTTPLAVILAYANDEASGIAYGVWLVIWFALTLAGPFAVIGNWIEQLQIDARDRQTSTGDWIDAPGNSSRRAILRQAIAGALTFGFGGWITGSLLDSTGVGSVETAEAEPLGTVRTSLQPAPDLPTPVPAAALEDTFPVPDGVRSRITANDNFYLIDISTRKPAVSETDWTLRIHGLVDREVLLTYSDLLSLPSVEQDVTQMCISFTYPNDLISSTRYTGVRLRDVLQMAGISDSALELVVKGGGGYSDSIPIAKALEAGTLLAYGMNGTTLPRKHGFPCRLYVPNIYGEKSVKWLEEIQVVDFDYSGYWQERGWSDDATIQITSIIDTPNGDVSRNAAGIVPVGGIAFAGTRGIQSVQIQVDNGPWVEATVEPYDPELLWQRWTYDWAAQPGGYRLSVQAIDGNGATQDITHRDPYPDGMTGLHQVGVQVI